MSSSLETDASRPNVIGGSMRLLIDGQWVPSASGKEFTTVNPATGEVIAKLAEGDATDVDRAVAAARRAFDGEWSRWSAHDRRRLLLRVNDVVQENFDELARLETLDMGAPLMRTAGLKNWVSEALLFYAPRTDGAPAQSVSTPTPGTIP